MPAALSTGALTQVAIVCTMVAVVAAPYPAEAQEYNGKLTVAAYTADDQVTTDLNVRYSRHEWTGWVGWYGPHNSHLLIRHYLPHTRRLTVDVSYKSGRDDEGVYLRGSAQGMEYDWHRWFVKLAHDQHVNFTPATMWRAGGGLRF